MVAARATWTRWAPLRVSSNRVFVSASIALTNPVPALTCAAAWGSSAAAADRADTPGSARMTPAPSSSATAIMIGLFRFMTLLLCARAIHLTPSCDERKEQCDFDRTEFGKNALVGTPPDSLHKGVFEKVDGRAGPQRLRVCGTRPCGKSWCPYCPSSEPTPYRESR